jgi:hypothetical protein
MRETLLSCLVSLKDQQAAAGARHRSFQRMDNPRFQHTHTHLSPLTTDEMLELLDGEFLIPQCAFHQVANRDDAYKSATFDHREMTHGS